jgi:hypothetical protein
MLQYIYTYRKSNKHFLRYLYCLWMLFACIFFTPISAQVEPQHLSGNGNGLKSKNSKTSFSFSPMIGFYNTNIHHTANPTSKKAINVSLRKEFCLDKSGQNFLIIGIEYLFHGVNFKSYYFYEDSLKLYVPNRLNYQYMLTVNELNFPIQLKYSFQKENNTKFSSHIFGGYCHRWLMKGKLQVTDNERELENQSATLSFKNSLLSPVNSSFLTIGFGCQKNMPSINKSIFIETQYRYDLSAFYFEKSFAPTSLFINSKMLLITIGFKL